jgi:hypothetical protein
MDRLNKAPRHSATSHEPSLPLPEAKNRDRQAGAVRPGASIRLLQACENEASVRLIDVPK